MDRRRYLGALGTTGLAAVAGCLDALGDDSRTALDPPDQPRGDPIHPTHGDAFPEFSLRDPLADVEVSSADLEGDRTYLLTFIYTSCTEACGTLVRLLQLVQEDAAERDYDDDVALLAMTFDPETDDAAALREYAGLFDVDLEAGNFHFLRPESNERALELVNERFGVPAEFGDSGHDEEDDSGEDDQSHADDDHHDEEDHDHHDSALHYYMLFVVNESGIVERSYPNVVDNREETRPKAIIEDVRTVVE